MQVFKVQSRGFPRSDRHVTLRFGSSDIGIVFPFRDQKNTNLVRDPTQSIANALSAWALNQGFPLRSSSHAPQLCPPLEQE